jgi:HPt (histidine-containing phosphotransfer) domain-containing protein
MEAAMDQEDMESISEDAHKMAASCEQIGAVNLAILIRQLEENARQAKGTGLVITTFQLVKAEVAKVISFLKLYLQEHYM